MAATDQTYRNQYSLDVVFAVSSILMLVSIVWMLVQDFQREWKTEQRVFRDVEVAMAQREALAQQLRAREEEFRAGRRTVDILLEAQRFWSDALANEYNAVVAYNNALCAFEYVKGAITQYAHVTITDHPDEPRLAGAGASAGAVRAFTRGRS